MGNSEIKDALFDKADFIDRVEGDMELAAEIAEMFLEDAAENMDKIRQAAFRKDFGALGQAAHSLKGASANLAGMRVRQAAADLERAAKESKPESVKQCLALLEAELAAFRSALQDQILSVPGG
ncbi:MAG: Hpt domain-containing protein [Desulfosalsimonas sp.]